MTGINAHTDAGFVFHTVNNRRQMLELKPQIAALTGGVFNHGGDAFGLRQRNVDGLGNSCQAFIFGDLH